MKTGTILIIISLLAIALIFSYKLGEKNAEIKYVREIDTLVTYQTIHDTVIKPKFYTVVKKDTIRDTVNNVIFIKDSSKYVAEVDSTYEDDLLKLNVKYVSDIPLSYKSYFNIKADVKKEVVFVPTKVDPSWWYKRFGFFLGAGMGYDTKTKQVNPQVGIYFGINLF